MPKETPQKTQAPRENKTAELLLNAVDQSNSLGELHDIVSHPEFQSAVWDVAPTHHNFGDRSWYAPGGEAGTTSSLAPERDIDQDVYKAIWSQKALTARDAVTWIRNQLASGVGLAEDVSRITPDPESAFLKTIIGESPVTTGLRKTREWIEPTPERQAEFEENQPGLSSPAGMFLSGAVINPEGKIADAFAAATKAVQGAKTAEEVKQIATDLTPFLERLAKEAPEKAESLNRVIKEARGTMPSSGVEEALRFGEPASQEAIHRKAVSKPSPPLLAKKPVEKTPQANVRDFYSYLRARSRVAQDLPLKNKDRTALQSVLGVNFDKLTVDQKDRLKHLLATENDPRNITQRLLHEDEGTFRLERARKESKAKARSITAQREYERQQALYDKLWDSWTEQDSIDLEEAQRQFDEAVRKGKDPWREE